MRESQVQPNATRFFPADPHFASKSQERHEDDVLLLKQTLPFPKQKTKQKRQMRVRRRSERKMLFAFEEYLSKSLPSSLDSNEDQSIASALRSTTRADSSFIRHHDKQLLTFIFFFFVCSCRLGLFRLYTALPFFFLRFLQSTNEICDGLVLI